MLGAFYMKRVHADVAAGKKADGFGFHAQAGYFFVPKKLQVAARFAMVPYSGNKEDDKFNDLELRGAFNYYFHGHQWKWATDFGITQRTGEDAAGKASTDDPNIEIRSMAQLTF
jgi:hypothetical protein